MDIHKPKPIHNWRDFLKEVGIIVLGVSIALAAEQAVETMHNRSRAEKARANVHVEIARNIGLMVERERQEPCVRKRLAEVEVLVAGSAAGQKLPDTIWLGQPAGYLMQDGKYKAALASGDASLFDEQEQAVYADLYASFASYWQTAMDEQKAWASLRVLEKHPAPSPTLDWQLRNALEQARIDRYYLQVGRWNGLRDGAAIGITPDKAIQFRPTICLALNTVREEAGKLSRAHDRNIDLP